MKNKNAYYILLLSAVFAMQSCQKTDEDSSPFDNAVYIDAAKNDVVDKIQIKKRDISATKILKAALALPESNNIDVSIAVDYSLIDMFNSDHYITTDALPLKYYSIDTQKAVIAAGNTHSTPMNINFVRLNEIPQGVTYLLPVKLTNASNGMGMIEGSRTIYYMLNQSAPITTVANIESNHLYVPKFATAQGTAPLRSLSTVTMECLFRSHNFEQPDRDAISSLFGVEGHFLLRVGDVKLYRDQLQLAGSGWSFPEKSAEKRLKVNTWYHVAVTYDATAGDITIYVNGEIQSQTKGTHKKGTVNMSVETFFIGKSYNDLRYLSGEISECRIWSVIRSQAEIKGSMYDVDTNSYGLQAYWKFDENQGDLIKDYSINGYEAQAKLPLTWVPVELPANQ